MTKERKNERHYSLSALNGLVRKAISECLPDEYWVEAELSECHEHSGHCYMELIEKADDAATPIARASVKCWRSTWQIAGPHFLRVTGQPLSAGMKVLLRVYAQFHEAFGFSWIVSDIDPTYTLGDMARRRQEIIAQLKSEGVFDMQRELVLPLFAQRIAVVSAATAAGYGDFCHQLANNDYGFRFDVTLFPAVMQGEQVEQSIISALNSIYDDATSFDVVVIIRGGGATADLSGFDTLALAENVAQFPLPIITGIGHERDESVIDMVSFQCVKTPTAAAALLIDHLATTLSRINDAETRLNTAVSTLLAEQSLRLSRLAMTLPALVARNLSEARQRLAIVSTRLPAAAELLFTTQRHRLGQIEMQLKSIDPAVLLKRGYSITTHNGRIVRQPSDVATGDLLETRLADGVIRSEVV